MAKSPTREVHKPANRSPIPAQHELDDYGFSHSVTTMKSPSAQSSINLKDSGLGNPQSGTGGSRHKRTGHRVT